MTPKKSKKANLENRKNSYLQIGLIVAISFTLVAFEWSTDKYKLDDLASVLPDEISSEIVKEVQFTKPSTPKPPQKESSSTKGTEAIVTEEIPEKKKVEEKKIFEEVDPFQFVEETTEPQDIETVTYVPKPKTYYAGNSLFDGTLPHYSECDGLSKDKMFDCISDQINSKLSPKTRNITSLRSTGAKRVTATFIVDENGNVSEVYVHSEKKFEKDLVKEVKRAIFDLPQMIPGSQGGKQIKARFTLPINFTIQN